MTDMLARLHARATGSEQLLQTRTAFRFAVDGMAAPVPSAPATEPGPVAAPVRHAPPAPAAEAAAPLVPPARPSPAAPRLDPTSPVEPEAAPARLLIDPASPATTAADARPLAPPTAEPAALLVPPAPASPGATTTVADARPPAPPVAEPAALLVPPTPSAPVSRLIDRPEPSHAEPDPDRGHGLSRPVPTAVPPTDTGIAESSAFSAPTPENPASPRPKASHPAPPGPSMPDEDASPRTGHPPAPPRGWLALPQPGLPPEPTGPVSDPSREVVASRRPIPRTPAPLVTEPVTASTSIIEPDSPARVPQMQVAPGRAAAVSGGPPPGFRWPSSDDLPAPAAVGRDATAALETRGRSRSSPAVPPAEIRVDIGQIEVVLPAAPPPVVRRRPQPPAMALKPRRGSEP